MLRYLSIIIILSISCKSDKQGQMLIEETPQKEINEVFLLGTWQNINDSEIDFILHLNIDDGTVAGEYCSKAKQFYFEDCALEDEGSYCSVRGRMEQLRISLETESCVTYELGEAELARENAQLKWILKKAPGKFAENHLMPDTMTLKKISNEPFF